ncbi:MAG: RNA-binding protein [Spirochaetes bacterium RBG_16_67_19]|jgi:RNA recognition motif-containing protein|nr:MAG: RNA-binding protein [Spirochaetes bacterium GWB1_66_5]OHD71899.1 MAG: RNA-binding protein [Spirochaetes bacterium RBG_16_67_19]
MANKIYVGNLNYDTQESDLRALFSAHGAVQSVSIITDRDTGRSKGFGFVEMADGAATNAAITALNGKELDGRTLRVNMAMDRPRR